MKTNIFIIILLALSAWIAYQWASFKSIFKWKNDNIDIF